MKTTPKVPIQLTVEDGMLCTPRSAIVDDLQRKYWCDPPSGKRSDNLVMVCRHDEGDADTIKWPRPNKKNLARALYDDREMGIIPDSPIVLLPDGTEFNIDSNVQ